MARPSRDGLPEKGVFARFMYILEGAELLSFYNSDGLIGKLRP